MLQLAGFSLSKYEPDRLKPVLLAPVAAHARRCDNSATRETLRERRLFRGKRWECETLGWRSE